MGFFEYYVGWMFIGMISSIAAIARFRPNGTKRPEELYLAVLGPFFGPIVTVLLLLDLFRSK